MRWRGYKYLGLYPTRIPSSEMRPLQKGGKPDVGPDKWPSSISFQSAGGQPFI